MSDSERTEKLSRFMRSGIYRFENSNAVFIDPVRVLDRSYTRFRVYPSTYYSRFFDSKHAAEEPRVSSSPRKRKRKRKEKQPHPLNEKELTADKRHQEARPFLLKAHESLLKASDLLSVMCKLRSGDSDETECVPVTRVGQSFIELGKVWQSHMYEMTINYIRHDQATENGGSLLVQHREPRVVPIFNNLVVNETSEDLEAEFFCSRYIVPRESCFYMSDISQINKLIPANPDCGFNLVVIDPPWENRSAHQKSMYPTLPNLYFLSLPIKQLSHTKGALVALWVTNREKLRNFVEKELFPKWEVKHVATFFWLKVRADGSLISELDLFHHRPYECLLLGYCHGQVLDCTQSSTLRDIQDKQVIISVPGDYSRKPPIGELLLELVPALKPARSVELFAREMVAGWTSWGNEPLQFQESRYFLKRSAA